MQQIISIFFGQLLFMIFTGIIQNIKGDRLISRRNEIHALSKTDYTSNDIRHYTCLRKDEALAHLLKIIFTRLFFVTIIIFIIYLAFSVLIVIEYMKELPSYNTIWMFSILCKMPSVWETGIRDLFIFIIALFFIIGIFLWLIIYRVSFSKYFINHSIMKEKNDLPENLTEPVFKWGEWKKVNEIINGESIIENSSDETNKGNDTRFTDKLYERLRTSEAFINISSGLISLSIILIFYNILIWLLLSMSVLDFEPRIANDRIGEFSFPVRIKYYEGEAEYFTWNRADEAQYYEIYLNNEFYYRLKDNKIKWSIIQQKLNPGNDNWISIAARGFGLHIKWISESDSAEIPEINRLGGNKSFVIDNNSIQ